MDSAMAEGYILGQRRRVSLRDVRRRPPKTVPRCPSVPGPRNDHATMYGSCGAKREPC